MTLVTVSRLRNYVNQRVPVLEYLRSPDYDTSPLFSSWEVQYTILEILTTSVLQLNPNYVKQFLKEFIDRCEKDEVEMIDEIYELMCDPKVLSAVEMDPTKKDIIKYYVGRAETEKDPQNLEPIEDLNYVTIKETPRLISGFNTTGSRTWEASVYLASLLNSPENSIDFTNKSVLELGAGTGLLSLALYKYHHRFVNPIKEIVVTDGYTSLIDNFSEALYLNDIFIHSKVSPNASSRAPALRSHQLWWGSTNPSTKEYIQSPPPNIDILVAADVTYDSSIHDILCSTIHDFFTLSGTKVAIIAAAVRDERTIDHWEEELTKWFPKKWTVEKDADPDTMDNGCWFKKGSPKMKVYQIKEVS